MPDAKGPQAPGFEVICTSRECEWNDHPICVVHTADRPVLIGQGGKCQNYKRKEEGGKV